MLTALPAPMSELYAWYCVDLSRTMAWHLGVPPTTTYKASTLIHKYLSLQPPEKLDGFEYAKPTTLHIAAASLLAVAKIDCYPLRLGSLVTVCDRVGRRRFQKFTKGAPVPTLIPPTGDESDLLRQAIINMEWHLLSANAFVAICELPHTFALVFLRATCKQSKATSAFIDDEVTDAEDGFAPAAVTLVNTVLSLCSDASRSRGLMLDTSAPAIAAAAIAVASERLGTPMSAICPEWYTILKVTEKELNLAVARLKNATSTTVSMNALLSFAASNPGLQVNEVVPAPTAEELAERRAAKTAQKQRDKTSRKKDKDKEKEKDKDKAKRKSEAKSGGKKSSGALSDGSDFDV